MSNDPFYHITAEVQQLLTQDDFDGAQRAIREFCENRHAQLRSQITLLSSQLSRASEAVNRYHRYDDDYLPYPEEDYRD